jgi:DNA-damage-inducible protein J
MPKVKMTSEAAKTGMIRARVDPDLKVRAETILATLGLNASDAIRLFYTQVTLNDGLPFDVRIPNAATRKTIRDARAGKNLSHYDSTTALFDKLGI